MPFNIFLLVAGNWYRIFFHCDTGIKTQLALYPKFAEQNSIVTFIMCIRHIVWNPRSYVQWLSHQPMSWLPFISCCVLKGVSLFGEMKHETRKWTSKNSRHVYVFCTNVPRSTQSASKCFRCQTDRQIRENITVFAHRISSHGVIFDVICSTWNEDTLRDQPT